MIDKSDDRARKTLKSYWDTKESSKFEAELGLVQLLFSEAVITPTLSVVGVPARAIGIALIGIQFGYLDERPQQALRGR
ncbi:hypothetical protein [Caballeronia sp. M23-90]